jgi:iron complex outermembrane recepter protein
MIVRFLLLASAASVGISVPLAHASEAAPNEAATIAEDSESASSAAGSDIVVTARKRVEKAQDVPIALSVLGADTLSRQGTFSFSQVGQQVPTLQYTSSNPRNTAINIRGLGVSFGLANDGLEQGVGFYVDGVYNSRPAAASFDLLDVDRVEVLRGPQGTLFGKNTTAGALNISTKLPSFDWAGEVEGSIGTHKFVQAKASLTGPFSDAVAFRVSASHTSRDGFVKSTRTGRNVNDLDNLGIRGQLLFKLSDAFNVRLIGDYNLSDADCCTQVFYVYGQTLKSANRQFPALAASLGYSVPGSFYDRLADVDGRLNARSESGGFSLNADYDFGNTTLTSISAWRWWDWKPANDRDYTSLDIVRQSANPVQQNQYSQELRLSSNGKNVVDFTVGAFAYYQKLKGQNVTEWGKDADEWLLFKAGDKLSGYTTTSKAVSTIESYAAYGQATWHVTDALSLTPGLRYTYERKKADYAAIVFGGGLAVPDADMLSIFRPQAFPNTVKVNKGAVTGDVNLSYKVAPDVLVYGSYARGFKSAGINLAGLPFNASNLPVLSKAVVSPEKNQSYELGVKSQFFNRLLTANIALFRSDVKNFQANVVDTGPGALRGYLANIEKVRSQGVEWDLSVSPVSGFSGYVRGAYTKAKYVSFANAPCPLELIANSTGVCDLSGKQLPGTSPWSVAWGLDYSQDAGAGKVFVGLDANYRSSFYADSSDSKYLRIKGYGLANVRLGYRAEAGWEVFGLVRNLFDKNYAVQLTPQTGNSGFISGIPGDPRTFQVTARYKF